MPEPKTCQRNASPTARRMAEAIAEELFRNAAGQRGDNLSLAAGKKTLARWSKVALTRFIAQVLDGAKGLLTG
jgi:hypothetical protein